MTPEQIELARRLVAHPRWAWKPGMQIAATYWLMSRHGRCDIPGSWHDGRVVGVQGVDGECARDLHGYPSAPADDGSPLVHDDCGNIVASDARDLPDLTDDATAGVLLGVLALRMRREPWDDAVWPHGTGWRVRRDGGIYPGAALGEACARALLAL